MKLKAKVVNDRAGERNKTRNEQMAQRKNISAMKTEDKIDTTDGGETYTFIRHRIQQNPGQLNSWSVNED